MRISFSVDLKPSSGKQKFAIALASAFKRMGVKVVKSKPDINLTFIKGHRKGCLNILRLDGAWINSKMNSAQKNKKIAKGLKSCAGVIYQSKYSKKVCETFIGKHKRSAVIFNGCNPDSFSESHIHPRPYVFACSRWRPHKRLKVIVQTFLDSGISDRYDLLICGEADYVKKHSAVKYLGQQKSDAVAKFTKGCSFVVHLAFMDCCPNSVVEALVAGKPVLHTDSGGTHEIVRDSGICIQDKPFKFRMIDLYNSPKLDKSQIIQAYQIMAQDNKHVVREDLYIDRVAENYLQFIKKVRK